MSDVQRLQTLTHPSSGQANNPGTWSLSSSSDFSTSVSEVSSSFLRLGFMGWKTSADDDVGETTIGGGVTSSNEVEGTTLPSPIALCFAHS